MSNPNTSKKKKKIETKSTMANDPVNDQIKKIIDKHASKFQSAADNKNSIPEKKLIGYYSGGYAELFGSWIWKMENGKEVTITEVCEEGKQPLTVGCLINYVGPVKQFVKRLCPTGIDKEANCLCKCGSDVFVLSNKQLTLKDQGF